MFGVVELRRDGGRIEKEMVSGGRLDWVVRARDRRNREDECDASRLWAAEVAEVETQSAQVLEMTVGRSQGYEMGAQVRKV